MAEVPTVVSCSWLAANLDKVKPLDASWYLPTMERSPGVKYDAAKDFATRRIPGAFFFDIDKISDTSNPLPHMMPPPDFFAKRVGELGISKDSHVVVYDGKGAFSCPRAWYMFKAMGHPKVSILDGGFPKWEAEGCPLETAPKTVDDKAPQAVQYVCSPVANSLLDMPAVEANVRQPAFQLIDARPKPRFLGEAPEPRPIESGHIEGSFALPWTDVLTPGGEYKSPDEIREVLQAARVDLSKPMAVTCGSGVSACVIRAALDIIGVESAPLYDGAYTEWKQAGKPTFKGTEKSPYARL